MSDDKVEYIAYSTAKFFVHEGYYSVNELQAIVDRMKAMYEAHSKHLRKSIEPLL